MVIAPRVGPRGDSYFPERTLIMTEEEAEEYHSQQINWLAETEADMVMSVNNNFEQKITINIESVAMTLSQKHDLFLNRTFPSLKLYVGKLEMTQSKM